MIDKIKHSKPFLRNNENLKTANFTEHITADEFEFRVAEIAKCKADPVYFAERYYTIVAIDTGRQIIKLYDKQRDLLKAMAANTRTVCLASRRSGKTVAYSIYALWSTIFNNDKKVLICAQTSVNAVEFLANIRLAFEDLPNWLKPGCKEYNKKKIIFGNDSSITAAMTSSGVRGLAASTLILDEFAFIDNNVVDEFWTAVYPVVSSSRDAKVIIVSTPNGVGNLYYKIYKNAVDNPSGEWTAVRIDWWDVPNRDEKWKQQTIDSLCRGDLRAWRQEYENCVGYDTIITVKNIETGKIENIKIGDLYKSFIANIFEVLTPSGFQTFKHIKQSKSVLYTITLSNVMRIQVTLNHIFNVDGTDIEFSKMKLGDKLNTKNGAAHIISIECLGEADVYDLCNVGTDNLYYTNDIVSHNCFFGSSYTLLSAEALEVLPSTISKEFTEFKFKNDMVASIWKKPQRDHYYIVGGDVAEGVGGDSSVAVVLDVTNPLNIEVAATFKNNYISPVDFAYVIVTLCKMYNQATLALECNSIGKSTLDTVFNTFEYDNIVNLRKAGSYAKGILSNFQIKFAACMWARDYTSAPETKLILNDAKLLEELRVFERLGDSEKPIFRGVSGEHDDLVMAFIWALYILNEAVVEKYFEVAEWFETTTKLKIPKKIVSYYSAYFDPNAMESINTSMHKKELTSQMDYATNSSQLKSTESEGACVGFANF